MPRRTRKRRKRRFKKRRSYASQTKGFSKTAPRKPLTRTFPAGTHDVTLPTTADNPDFFYRGGDINFAIGNAPCSFRVPKILQIL